jgi:hypothetical protein
MTTHPTRAWVRHTSAWSPRAIAASMTWSAQGTAGAIHAWAGGAHWVAAAGRRRCQLGVSKRDRPTALLRVQSIRETKRNDGRAPRQGRRKILPALKRADRRPAPACRRQAAARRVSKREPGRLRPAPCRTEQGRAGRVPSRINNRWSIKAPHPRARGAAQMPAAEVHPLRTVSRRGAFTSGRSAPQAFQLSLRPADRLLHRPAAVGHPGDQGG